MFTYIYDSKFTQKKFNRTNNRDLIIFACNMVFHREKLYVLK